MIKNLKKLIEYPEEGILNKRIFKYEKSDVSLFCMTSGTEISPHTSTKEGIIYIIEGNGVFNLDGKDIKMERGVIIHMKEGDVHSLKAVKNTSFLLILI